MSKKKINLEEIHFGDFVHIEEDMDVLALGSLHGEYLVGTDGDKIDVFNITDETRFCTKDEYEAVKAVMRCKGYYVYPCGEFYVLDDEEEDENEDEDTEEYDSIVEELECVLGKDLVKAILDRVEEVVGERHKRCKKEEEKSNDEIELLEAQSKCAIDNIIGALNEDDLTSKEREKIIDALRLLIELGGVCE